MHVAVVGAGALGSVYGVALATRTDATVTFVVRAARVEETSAIIVERVKRDARDAIETPRRARSVPASADVIVLAVGTDDLDGLARTLGDSPAPIVVLTPMMPGDLTRMQAAFGSRVHAAMPAVVAYTRNDGVVRYWLPPVATRIDEPRAGRAGDCVRALARLLSSAGLRTQLAIGVGRTNPATTACFIPLAMALAVAGSLENLTRDRELMVLAARACAEGLAWARTHAMPDPELAIAPLLAMPWILPGMVALGSRLSAEGAFYAEEHFARKLDAQHRVMSRDLATLARESGLPHAALDALAARLA